MLDTGAGDNSSSGSGSDDSNSLWRSRLKPAFGELSTQLCTALSYLVGGWVELLWVRMRMCLSNTHF
jgi:hypothetical protein